MVMGESRLRECHSREDLMAEENRQRQVRKRNPTEPVVLVAECCNQHSRQPPVRAETGTALPPHRFLRQPRRARRLFPPALRRRGRGGRGGRTRFAAERSPSWPPSSASSPPASPPASRRRRVRDASLCVCPQPAWPRLPAPLPPSFGSAALSAPSVPPLLLPGQSGLRLRVFFPRILEAPNMFSSVHAQRQQVVGKVTLPLRLVILVVT
ncbi:unnamed protein product [Coccothraustes coccothraustes]